MGGGLPPPPMVEIANACFTPDSSSATTVGTIQPALMTVRREMPVGDASLGGASSVSMGKSELLDEGIG